MGIFAPAWQGKNEGKALRAVSKISDRAKLEEVANNAPLEIVRYCAIKRHFAMKGLYGGAERLFNSVINTQSVLQMVALTDDESMLRVLAVAKLKDQAIIAQIAKNNKDESVRRQAVEQLTDQSVLSYIVKNDPYSGTRQKAVKKITDQGLLSDIAKNDQDESVRKDAVIKVDDQSVLADISINDIDWEVRRNAIWKVTDQSVIGDYLVKESQRKGSYAWFSPNCDPKGLLKKISIPSVITYVAKEIQHEFLAPEAVKMITDEATLISIAKSSKSNEEARGEAIKRINDDKVFVELAMEPDACFRVRREAIDKLTDLAVLIKLARKDPNKDIRDCALFRLINVCPHEWSNGAHCLRKCAICGLYNYDHDYIQVNMKEYGGASLSKDYVCKKCGHEANYSQGETTCHDTRETGYFFK